MRPLLKSPYLWVVLSVWLLPLIPVIVANIVVTNEPIFGPVMMATILYPPTCVLLTAGACEATYWILRFRARRNPPSLSSPGA